MATFFTKKQSHTKKTTKPKSPEMGSAMVRVSHKISANNSKGQVVKIGDKYYRIKELG